MNIGSTVEDGALSSELLAVPPRSYLYCLEPVAVSTGEPESATSYVSRLALAHTVSTWSLLKCEIAPRLFGPEAIIRNRLSELLAGMGSACNGENSTSRQFVSILNSLTGRNDLERTTMSFCQAFICSRFLVRVKQAWCPLCLEEWRENGKEIHWPLLWHVMAVTMCPWHFKPLVTKCPSCSQSFFPLVARAQPGFCNRCHKWLGASEPTEGASLPKSDEYEVAQIIAQFLKDGPIALKSTKQSFFPSNIETLIESGFQGNLQAFSRHMGFSRASIVEWKRGVQRPTLLSVAEICKTYQISPVAPLCSAMQPEEFRVDPAPPREVSKKTFVPPPKSDLHAMRRALEESLKDETLPPASLSKIASDLGCRQTTLVRRFPEEAKMVKERYEQYRSIRKEVRSKLVRSQVHSVVVNIHNSGDYPSQYLVRQALPKSIDMREHAAYDEWRRTLAELGLGLRGQPLAGRTS